MAKQILKQVPKRPKPAEQADAPTVNKKIAATWFGEGS